MVLVRQGCKSVSSIGGDDRHILVILILGGGDDFKISYLWILLCPKSCFFYSFSPDFY